MVGADPGLLRRVQVLKHIFRTDDNETWDLSDPTERTAYYELALVHGLDQMLRDSVDGLLLIQAWPHMHLPDVVREAWQPVIDAATASQDQLPRDPGGFSARIAGEIGIAWPPPTTSRRRQRHMPRPSLLTGDLDGDGGGAAAGAGR